MGEFPHSWIDLAAAAEARVTAHEDHPSDRRRLREAFYAQHACSGLGRYGYGTAEIAFLQWEIDRGVLNALDAPEPGSRWWRGVNHRFNVTSETAGLGHSHGLSRDGAPTSVALWLDYLDQPSRRSWYRAHTRSIQDGVDEMRPHLRDEPAREQVFIRRVLRRLAAAHRLSQLPGPLGVFADPRLGVVDALTRTPLYSRSYPHPGSRLTGTGR